MTSTRADAFNTLLYAHTAAAALFISINLDITIEMTTVRVFAVVVTLAHVHYGVCVVSVCACVAHVRTCNTGESTMRSLQHPSLQHRRSWCAREAAGKDNV